MTLEKWHPLRELDVMRREMDRLWDDFFPVRGRNRLTIPLRRFSNDGGIAIPAIDVIDRKDEILVRAELPGIDKDKLDISIEDDNLTIKGELREEKEVKKEDYYHCERSYSMFARTVALPVKVNADKVKASFRNGLLEVKLPKSEKLKPRKVSIDVGK